MVSGWGLGMHSRVQTFLENGMGSDARVSGEQWGGTAEREMERKTT